MPDQTPPTSKPSLLRRSVNQIQITLGVAILLATLFTAWTPGQFAAPSASGLAANPVPTISQSVETPGTQAPQRPVIGIVAGHWGNDPGAVCEDGLREADVNLDIATLVQKYLVEQGYEVDLLKEFDPRLTGYQALALVSIHNDSCVYINDQATGFKVAAALASTRPERSARLTSCLRSRYNEVTELPLHSTSVTNDMTNYHAFGEIGDNTAAAIIETGFLNRDRIKLTEETDVIARGVAEGILCFVRNESISATPTAQPAP